MKTTVAAALAALMAPFAQAQGAQPQEPITAEAVELALAGGVPVNQSASPVSIPLSSIFSSKTRIDITSGSPISQLNRALPFNENASDDPLQFIADNTLGQIPGVQETELFDESLRLNFTRETENGWKGGVYFSWEDIQVPNEMRGVSIENDRYSAGFSISRSF